MQKWAEIIGHARGNVDFLKDQDVIRTVLNILQVRVYTIYLYNWLLFIFFMHSWLFADKY